MKRVYASGTIWEPIAGYSRAVRNGSMIWVSGTTATDKDGNISAKEDAYLQTIIAIQNIEKALEALDANLGDVVRTRIYIKDMSQWKDVAKAHAEYFSKVKPAKTLIEVSRFVDPEILVEIEADAVTQ